MKSCENLYILDKFQDKKNLYYVRTYFNFIFLLFHISFLFFFFFFFYILIIKIKNSFHLISLF